MRTPDVSVVMAVHNGAAGLVETLDSIFAQDGAKFEVIVVDDGSHDGTDALLRSYSERVGSMRILRQRHEGLTAALIRGCAQASAPFIARHDVGDLSLPGRLRRQFELLADDSDAVFVSCGTRFVGPQGEWLYDVQPDEDDSARGFASLDRTRVYGPAGHGSVMFSRVAYERVGGYRRAFYFAQDLDLWLRLSEVGRFRVVPDILFQTDANPASLSGVHRAEQVRLADQAFAAARARRNGSSEAAALTRAAAIRPRVNAGANGLRRARAYYFIGACLRRRDPIAARRYFRLAIEAFPLHWRSWGRLLLYRHRS